MAEFSARAGGSERQWPVVKIIAIASLRANLLTFVRAELEGLLFISVIA
jgi:hypothetical protein